MTQKQTVTEKPERHRRPSNIVRVRYHMEGDERAKTILLDGVGHTRIAGIDHITGAEVDREGAPTGRSHIITASLVLKQTPMEWDLFYGKLVQASA